MFGALPCLAPRDSYDLWYTPIHNSSSSNTALSHSHSAQEQSTNLHTQTQNQNRRHQDQFSNRTLLARLRHDEHYLLRTKAYVSNFGATWIKPPGLPKSLQQARDEKREAAEQIEMQRREQRAAELEAAAEEEEERMQRAAQGLTMVDMAGVMDTGERDLDDEIPDADAAETTGLDVEDQTDEDTEPDSEDEADATNAPANWQPPQPGMAADGMRAAMMQGHDPLHFVPLNGSRLGEDNADDPNQMLEEDDLVRTRAPTSPYQDQVNDMDMEMEADLDDDVPEADEEYEHTDTEEELSSSEEESEEDQSLPLAQPVTVTGAIMHDRVHNSIDLSTIDLRGESSFLASSPGTRGMPGSARSRRTRHA